ncbi:Ubiquitin carboxyl-terminal hydrolase [Pseudolycoriella hygida]|uniref:Ubiquitin carboxyl-terminal hydrolase n=1 Tax=Pseudolycoriella hygida TaxID=35572 RepID=A0A9Q0MWM9_9DIPT|nr:Ubiquitin carboxyl-terminal hydrolase [Pseudolycoriella hygida]
MSNWIPLQSNPEILNMYLRKLGVSEDWSAYDVLGLDPELLELVPKPAKALILLFPCSEKYEQYRLAEDAKLKETNPEYPSNLFYMKQTIPNACGACALIHAISNNEDISLDDGILKNYLKEALDRTPEERGKLLEENKSFTDTHEDLASDGPPESHAEGENNHYVALIQKDGELYELDGRKSFPVKHGPTTAEQFLEDAAKVCKEFMARDPDEIRFTVSAIAPTEN